MHEKLISDAIPTEIQLLEVEMDGVATEAISRTVAEALSIEPVMVTVRINEDNPWFSLLEIDREEDLKDHDIKTIQKIILEPLDKMGVQITRNTFSSKKFMYYIYTKQSFV